MDQAFLESILQTSDSAIGNLNLATIRITISAIVFQVCVPATCALVPTPTALNPRLFFEIRHEGVFGFTEADAIACNSPHDTPGVMRLANLSRLCGRDTSDGRSP